MNLENITTLDWDSNFFNLHVGKVILSSKNTIIANTNKFDLIYLLQSDIFDYDIKGFCKTYTDVKITFEKELTSSSLKVKNSKIILNPNISHTSKLIDLSLQSGVYSRFKLDPNFKESSFKELYKKWITNAINKETEQLLVYVLDNEIKGILTFSESNNYAKIGLLSVDKNERGKSIGSSLLSYLENYLTQKNIYKLLIDTQEINTLACNFYKKHNYTIQKKQYLKHYWKI